MLVKTLYFSLSFPPPFFTMTAAVSASADLPTIKHAFRDPHPHPASWGARVSINRLGLLPRSVLPSLGFHGGLSVIAYGLARASDRVDIKDYLWPTGMVLHAWWTAVGRHSLLAPRAPVVEVLQRLSYSQKLLLGAVSAWGGRLFYRVMTRSLRRGGDDPRYKEGKTQRGFWRRISLLFGLEAVFQTLISLPFTLPFRADSVTGFSGAPVQWASTIRWTAAGIFTAGLALETLADWQLDSHKRRANNAHGELLRSGVWSIVRHPNYLGDALVHLSFPLWCYGSQLFGMAHVVSPAANYFFLRRIGGDRENEAAQASRYATGSRQKQAQWELYQSQKNSFWPSISELANVWTWVVVGVGVAGAAAEYFYEARIMAAVTAFNPVDPVVGETLAGLQ